MNYVSVCSGIEAATVAWAHLNWRPLLFAEIASFPSRVLQHHYPSVPNVGDFTSIRSRSDVDLLVGGTPCQAFSVAGLRAGLADDRGNLALEFLRLADRLRARWLLWENVPGVLSSNGGRDFGSILGALGELGYGFAWRVLDAQFFGVPQRRRRVFLVGHLGDWRRAAAVLSERSSMLRDTPKGRKKGDQIAEAGSVHAGLARGSCVSVTGQIAHTLRAEGCDASEDGTGRGTPVIAFAENSRGEIRSTGDVVSALSTGGGKPGQGYPAIAVHCTQDPIRSARVSPALSARGQVGVTVGAYGERAHAVTCHAVKGGDPTTDNYAIAAGRMRVRKLTPRECERLQGFPDDYTLIPGAKDTSRYHALGNSMCTHVMGWLGERIAAVDAL